MNPTLYPTLNPVRHFSLWFWFLLEWTRTKSLSIALLKQTFYPTLNPTLYPTLNPTFEPTFVPTFYVSESCLNDMTHTTSEWNSPNLSIFCHFSQLSAQRRSHRYPVPRQSPLPRQSLLLLQLLPLFLPNRLQELVSYRILPHNLRMSQPTPQHCIPGRSENRVKVLALKAARPRRSRLHRPSPVRVPNMVTRTITKVYLVTTNVSMHHFRSRALKYPTARALHQTVCRLMVVTGSQLWRLVSLEYSQCSPLNYKSSSNGCVHDNAQTFRMMPLSLDIASYCSDCCCTLQHWTKGACRTPSFWTELLFCMVLFAW